MGKGLSFEVDAKPFPSVALHQISNENYLYKIRGGALCKREEVVLGRFFVALVLIGLDLGACTSS